MTERRRDQRHPMAAEVKISHPEMGERVLKTKNLSDHGLFVVTDPEQMPPMGSMVTCQVLREGEAMPVVPMKVVRVTEDGVGLLFTELEH